MTQTVVQKAVVTGASTGIGAVYARKLAERGYDVIAVARNAERLEANASRIRRETGQAVEVVIADLSQSHEVMKLADRIMDDRAIAFVVNNAGLSLQGGVLQNDLDEAAAMIAVNITAATLLSVAAAKAFSQRGRGGVVNISSVTAFAPEMFDGAYSGTKSHLINLTLSLAGKTKDAGVRFQAVLPGPTDTEMWGRSGVPESVVPRSMIMSPEDLVTAALVGFDKGEVLTLPTVADEESWKAYENARQGLWGSLAAGQPAPRYRQTTATA
ncbi:oxidoreductase [Rhizobium dioscoreae]|uniref:Oxidoreductase n=1 Tax=Rhizobium dioscoreae TaxID=2653122 RepID=A0ABQ0ZDC6_9HYPH|nr:MULTISPECIES: SDR family NAD(P)-dependent oxidoreductase [Rhizobium]GES45960.1 oxidoreductase [Rhizobium dioscoreae]GES53581.1 oxidoreductase [Rhizobium dioscoreae]GLU85040.1 oxidoreductase [Rhizobium sp. NBRC 114257]